MIKFIEEKSTYIMIIVSVLIVSFTIAIVFNKDYKDVQGSENLQISKEILNDKENNNVLIEEDTYKEDETVEVYGGENYEEDTYVGDTGYKENQESQENQSENSQIEGVKYITPINGTILKSFSDSELVYSKTLNEWNYHKGLDIEAEEGTAVRAIADGKVISVKQDELNGITIELEHKEGIVSKYSNLSTTNMIEIGKELEAGDIISGIGNTMSIEAKDLPHLHFELIKDGVNVNPLEYIDF